MNVSYESKAKKKKKAEMEILLGKKARSEPPRICPFHKLKSSLTESPDVTMGWGVEREQISKETTWLQLGEGKRFSWAVPWTLKTTVMLITPTPTSISSP